MHEYKATIHWKNTAGLDFLKGRYSRKHTWTFDGGLSVPASSSPYVVPLPWSVAANVDPEESYIASLSSCHMLTFIWLAGKAGFLVESYRDEATGVMAKNERGAFWVSKVTLHPQIVWGGDKTPTPAELDQLHHRSHEECFIANSVKTEIEVATISA
jgi:organic hydroperoxide reductase OsmC/OhrA